MKTEWKEDRLVMTPENAAEKEQFKRVFPTVVTRSKRIKVKEFVDKFGTGTDEYYLEVIGINGMKEGASDGVSG